MPKPPKSSKFLLRHVCITVYNSYEVLRDTGSDMDPSDMDIEASTTSQVESDLIQGYPDDEEDVSSYDEFPEDSISRSEDYDLVTDIQKGRYVPSAYYDSSESRWQWVKSYKKRFLGKIKSSIMRPIRNGFFDVNAGVAIYRDELFQHDVLLDEQFVLHRAAIEKANSNRISVKWNTTFDRKSIRTLVRSDHPQNLVKKSKGLSSIELPVNLHVLRYHNSWVRCFVLLEQLLNREIFSTEQDPKSRIPFLRILIRTANGLRAHPSPTIVRQVDGLIRRVKRQICSLQRPSTGSC